MPARSPENFDYLAVVSEWSSMSARGGVVGNAYPLLNLGTGEAVAAPQEDFPNPGAVFLMNRGNLNTWDFIVLRPRRNDRYRDTSDRDCYYIPARPPENLSAPNQAENVAVVLEHSAFDITSATRQIVNPRYNVTPLFFVQKNQTFIGPLVRDVTHLSPIEDIQRIDWRPAREDGIVYELTREELGQQGIRIVRYSHPDPSLNRVISAPIQLAIGNVRKVTSGIPRDALPTASLIEWYLQRCPTVDVPTPLLAALKASFRGQVGDDPAIQARRLEKIEREMAVHTAFLEQRERFARQYVDSEKGQQMVREMIEQAVARRSSEIEAEVDRREGQLASRRKELIQQFDQIERDHQRKLAALQKERQVVEERITDLNAATGQLQEGLKADAKLLAERMQDQLPLFAALTAGRGEAAAPIAERRASRPEFRPILPQAEVRPVESEARLVDAIHAHMAHRGLHFARDFIANIYTCLKSEALNLIIGPPGFGKSMLIAALARALGHEDAFLRIAVRRSWSEDRYLIGFFDKFHGRYDPGSTGLVPRMLKTDADWRQGRTGIYIVLLDEFNLAAPEYYFSQLLQALPSDAPVREIVLHDDGVAGADGFPRRITLAPNLRFWGTINYDETTERLSPRTLDRTGMIFLGDADIKPTIDDEPVPLPAVPAADVFDRFLRAPEECPEDRWEMVSGIIDILRSRDVSLGPRIELSPRVQRAIKRYLANSTDVLDARTAVDFVVQQRILPVVRGQGEDFLARVSRLAQQLSQDNLPRSTLHVEEALRRSERQFGELDFLRYGNA